MIIEFVGMASIAMIGYGCYLIYEPLGVLVPGVLLFFICALAAARRKG